MMYTREDDEKQKDEPLAAQYFLKADENACLSKRGVRWLLYYYRCVCKLPLLEKDIQRLQILAGKYDLQEEMVEVVDTVGVE